MTITQTIDAHDLHDMTWDCDDFWQIVEDQNLFDDVDNFFSNEYDGSNDLTDINDLLRYDAEYVLNALGADLHGSIWDDDEDEDEEDEDEEDED